MATYTCAKCGMGVNATCAKCDAPLENDSLVLGDGNSVQISRDVNELLANYYIQLPDRDRISNRYDQRQLVLDSLAFFLDAILIDISLRKVIPKIWTCRDGTVYQNRGYINTLPAEKQVVSNFAFVISQKTLATVVQFDVAFFSFPGNKIEQTFKLYRIQLQLAIFLCPPYWENREKPPFFNPFG